MLSAEEYLVKLQEEYGRDRYDAEPSFFRTFAEAHSEKDYILDHMNSCKEEDDIKGYKFWHSMYVKHDAMLGSYYSQMRRVIPNEIEPDFSIEEELIGELKPKKEDK